MKTKIKLTRLNILLLCAFFSINLSSEIAMADFGQASSNSGLHINTNTNDSFISTRNRSIASLDRNDNSTIFAQQNLVAPMNQMSLAMREALNAIPQLVRSCAGNGCNLILIPLAAGIALSPGSVFIIVSSVTYLVFVLNEPQIYANNPHNLTEEQLSQQANGKVILEQIRQSQPSLNFTNSIQRILEINGFQPNTNSNSNIDSSIPITQIPTISIDTLESIVLEHHKAQNYINYMFTVNYTPDTVFDQNNSETPAYSSGVEIMGRAYSLSQIYYTGVYEPQPSDDPQGLIPEASGNDLTQDELAVAKKAFTDTYSNSYNYHAFGRCGRSGQTLQRDDYLSDTKNGAGLTMDEILDFKETPISFCNDKVRDLNGTILENNNTIAHNFEYDCFGNANKLMTLNLLSICSAAIHALFTAVTADPIDLMGKIFKQVFNQASPEFPLQCPSEAVDNEAKKRISAGISSLRHEIDTLIKQCLQVRGIGKK